MQRYGKATLMSDAEYDQIVESCRPAPEDAERVATQRLEAGQRGYTKKDLCNRCGEPYDGPSPRCRQRIMHDSAEEAAIVKKLEAVMRSANHLADPRKEAA